MIFITWVLGGVNLITSVDKLCEENGLNISETVYGKSKKEMLEFQIISGKHYNFLKKEKGNILQYKNTVEILDFPMLVEQLPCLNSISYIKRNDFPYFTSGIYEIAKRMESGEQVAVEGGPCLFGTDEVTVKVISKSGKEIFFDYNTGKSYQEGSTPEETEDFGEFALRHGQEIKEIHFKNRKIGLTPQEWAFIKYPFEIAKAVNGPIVIPIPDFSYMKYLEAILKNVDKQVKMNAMEEFRDKAYEITDLYLDLIGQMQNLNKGIRCEIIHDRNKELCQKYYQLRAPYIERNKVIRTLTGIPEKLESIKDYVSMPALPHYLFGIQNVIEVDSMDETDSFRKCRKAHKGKLNLSCILFPELLSTDAEHTIFNTSWDRKEYGNYVVE